MGSKRGPLAVVGLASACASAGVALTALAQETASPAVDPSLAPYAGAKD